MRINPAIDHSRFVRSLILLGTLSCLSLLSRAASFPAGFVETDVGSGWNNPVGVAFGKNAGGDKDRIYVWDRWGRVWIMEEGVKLPAPLLDIEEEVADYGDYGMLGFALDPDFQQNGYIYVLYVVDRHYLIYYGTPQYNPTTNIRNQATIGRIARYTCRRSDDFRTVDPASRKLLLGESISTGFPILHSSHGVGSLVFATDGTLMASCGDAASYQGMDAGGNSSGAFASQALADGIITPAENIGAFRSQMIDSLGGKILRLDPATGNGVAGNPYYQSANPRSPRSRVWARGLRNPCRFCLKPGTGLHDPALGNPGVFYVGDVGWTRWEDMQVADRPGLNFGWPLYEGVGQQPEYWPARPSGMDAADHTLPAIDWHHGNNSAHVVHDGAIYDLGAAGSPVTGGSFGGNAACGGAWYTTSDFPAEWRNVYFQADFSGQWVRAFTMDADNQITDVRQFCTGESFVFLTTHPGTGCLYYCAVENGTKQGVVRCISYAPGGNHPPVAVASVDRQYGPSPLTVQFSSALSSDPDNTALTYSWNFGDGTTSTAANPLKTYTFTGPKRFDAVLTVRDAGGATASSAVIITVNNTPPVVQITSPAPDVKYPLDQGAVTYNLTANVTDAEQLTSTLTHQWQTSLVHDNHEHIEAAINATTATATISPLGNDPDSTYHYRIILRVTDPLGLTTTAERHFMPQTGTAAIVVNPDFYTMAAGSGKMLDVLANDHGAITDADFSTLQIVAAPARGAALPDPVTGRIRYLHNAAAGADSDSFTYRLRTNAGTLSAIATVTMAIAPAAANNAPVALSDSANAGRGQSVTIPLLNNDADAGGTLAPGSVVILTRPASGVLSLNAATGAVTYTHNNSAITADSFTYSVADTAGLRSEPATVRITITAQNGVPVLVNPGSQSTERGGVVNLQLAASDPDGQALTWLANGLPAGLAISSTTGRITGTVATTTASHTVTVTVSDGTLSASTAFAWTITAPPTGNGLLGEYFDGLTPGANPPLLTRTDSTINFDWGAGSPAPSVPADNFSARWTGELLPLYTETYDLALPVDNGVRVWIDGSLVLDKWLPVGTGGWHNFSVPLTGGKRTPFKVEYYEQWGGAGIVLYWASARQAFEVIPASAFAPAGSGDTTPPAATLSGPGGPVSGSFSVSISFSEAITGLTASDFTFTNATAGALDATGGAYTLTVIPATAGNVSVSLPAGRCFDGGGNGNTASNTYTVVYTPPGNRDPALTSPGDQFSLRGAIISLQIQASDPDGQPLTWSTSGLPAGLAINTSTGLIAGTVSLAAAASYNVSITARDPLNAAGSTSFTWATGSARSLGIRGEYYAGLTPGAAPALLVRTDSEINFDWGAASPGPGVPPDEFSVRWKGDLVPAWSETYTFTIAGDNGYRLWINNALVIDNWLPIGAGGWRSANVNLTAGQRTPVRLEYYEEWGGAGITWYWNSARQPWEVVPGSRLKLTPGIPGSAGTLLPAISSNFNVSHDPAGGVVITFNRPLTTGTAATIVEASADLLTWETIDIPASISRSSPGTENIRLQILAPPHVHDDGSVHQHDEDGSDEIPAARFYRVRLVDGS